MFPARGGSWPSAQPGSRRAPSGLLPRAQIPSRPLGPLTFLHVIVAENHGGRRGLQQRPRKRKEKRKRGSASARLTPLLSLREGCHKMRGPLGATGGGGGLTTGPILIQNCLWGVKPRGSQPLKPAALRRHFPDPTGERGGLLQSRQGSGPRPSGQAKGGSPTGGLSLDIRSPEAAHFGLQVVGLELVQLVPLGLLGKGELGDLLQVPARNGGEAPLPGRGGGGRGGGPKTFQGGLWSPWEGEGLAHLPRERPLPAPAASAAQGPARATHLSMVPNIHLGSLLKGITMPWKRAIFTAISAEMLGSGRSSVTRRRLCRWRHREALRAREGWREPGPVPLTIVGTWGGEAEWVTKALGGPEVTLIYKPPKVS